MKVRDIIVVLFLGLYFSSLIAYGQTEPKAGLSFKPARIDVTYRELITDSKGVEKNNDQLRELHKLINDSIMSWAGRFDLTKLKGFNNFGTFLGNKLNIPLSKKINMTFIDKRGFRADYYLWSLNPHKFVFEQTLLNKR